MNPSADAPLNSVRPVVIKQQLRQLFSRVDSFKALRWAK